MPDHLKYNVVSIASTRGGDIQFFVDLRMPFGLSSADRAFSMALEASLEIISTDLELDDVAKWVDDVVVIRYPVKMLDTSTGRRTSFNIESVQIWDALALLGWPLSIEKFRGFSSTVNFLGFEWDLSCKGVALPDVRRMKLLQELRDWLSNGTSRGITGKEASVLAGKLTTAAFVFTLGQAYLQDTRAFSIAHLNDEHRFFLPAAIIEEINFWKCMLAGTTPVPFKRLLKNPPRINNRNDVAAWASKDQIWVAFGKQWTRWKLLAGLEGHDTRDTKWAACIAIELTILHAIHACSRLDNLTLYVQSNSSEAIPHFNKGHSDNRDINLCPHRVALLTLEHKVALEFEYKPGRLNLTGKRRVYGPFGLPGELDQFLEEI